MKPKVYFTHIPKTAGRSIEAIYYKHKKDDIDYVAGEGYFRAIIKKKYSYYYEHFLKKKYVNLFINFDNKFHWNISFWHIPLVFGKIGYY